MGHHSDIVVRDISAKPILACFQLALLTISPTASGFEMSPINLEEY